MDDLERVLMHRGELSHAMNTEWAVETQVRAWHALYYIEPLDEWRSAVLVQRRGHNFQVGVTRDVSDGGAQELKSAVMTTLDAVIFLGLHLVSVPIVWEQVL